VYRYFLSHTARCWQSIHCMATSFDLAYRSSSGRLYKNNNEYLYTVCTFSVYFNAVRCDLLPHDTVSVYIPVRVQSVWWWPIWEVETSSQTINWSQSIDTRFVLCSFNDLLPILFCNFGSTLKSAVRWILAAQYVKLGKYKSRNVRLLLRFVSPCIITLQLK
jgi:hypothetical protein